MSQDKKRKAELWREIDAALGGRFRDGVECPEYAIELSEFAQAKVEGKPLPDNAEFLREHLEVCPVCRRIYQSALAAANDDTPMDEVANKSIPSTHLPGDRPSADVGISMALSDDGTPQTARRWNVSVRRSEASVDAEETPQSGGTASVRILWTSEGTLQVSLGDFLLPTADQKVQIIWMSGEEALLAQVELSCGEDAIVTLLPAARQPVASDQLHVRKLNQDQLLFEIDVTPTNWK